LTSSKRSKIRIVQAGLDVKGWLHRPPTVGEVLPGRCPACGSEISGARPRSR
jgi:hypothetical protein